MGKRLFGVSIEISFTLFAVCGLVALLFMNRTAADFRGTAIVIAVPAISSLALVVLTAILPGMLAPGRVAYPLNLTMPIVHAALMLVTIRLLLSGWSGVQTVPPIVRLIFGWLEVKIFVLMLVLNCLSLSGLAAITRKTFEAK